MKGICRITSRVSKLQREILALLGTQPRTLAGLEDHCEAWKEPAEIRKDLGELVVLGAVEQNSAAPVTTYGLTQAGVAWCVALWGR